MSHKSYAAKAAIHHKKRRERYAPYTPPSALEKIHRRPSLIHRGRLTEAALLTLLAVTSDQLF